MSYKTAKTQLKTILDAVASTKLKQTFKFVSSMPTKFPAGMLRFAGAGAERKVDQTHNELLGKYVVELIIPAEESEASADNWLDLLDAVTAELRKQSNWTLGGNAISVTVGAITQRPETNPQPLVVLSVPVDVKMLKSTT